MSEYKLVVIGASFGGLDALKILLSEMEQGFLLPIAVVLHRGKGSDETLTAVLQSVCPLTVSEAYDKQLIQPAHVYLAPPDYHLLIDEKHFALSLEAPVHYSRPSVDVLFESAAIALGGTVIGVILTGGNRDGAQGLAAIKQAGGFAIVQDPKTAENRTMPDAAIEVVPDAQIVSMFEIAEFLMKIIK